MVGKKPTRSPTARLMPLRHARYSAMLSIVRILSTLPLHSLQKKTLCGLPY